MGVVNLLEDTRKNEIKNLALEIDTFSEKYQLLHATVAIEKMFKDKMQLEYENEISEIRNLISMEKDNEKKDELCQRAKELKNESNKRIRITIDYSQHIESNSARTTRTQNNIFMILLPKSLESIRDNTGQIDFNRLKNLRKLMAHEIGHIALHSGIFGNQIPKNRDVEEEEANFFADTLIDLREHHSGEIVGTCNA